MGVGLADILFLVSFLIKKIYIYIKYKCVYCHKEKFDFCFKDYIADFCILSYLPYFGHMGAFIPT